MLCVFKNKTQHVVHAPRILIVALIRRKSPFSSIFFFYIRR
nr:MAG TPA: hypothetical protein [Caudoviricetes sp.]